jgi:hypothetical protein
VWSDDPVQPAPDHPTVQAAVAAPRAGGASSSSIERMRVPPDAVFPTTYRELLMVTGGTATLVGEGG